MLLQICHDVPDSIIGKHVTVCMICLIRMQNDHLTLGFLHILTQHLKILYLIGIAVQEIMAHLNQSLIGHTVRILAFLAEHSLGCPLVKELACLNGLLHRIRCVCIKLNVLNLEYAGIAGSVLPVVTGHGEHIVHP